MGDILWDDEPKQTGLITWDDVDPKASATVRQSLNTDPDKYAHIKQVANDAGLPFDTTERNIDDVAASQKLKQIQSLMNRNPVLARQLSDPAFAKVAHDDVSNLDMVGKTLLEPIKGLGGSFNDLFKAAGVVTGAIPTLGDKINTAIDGKENSTASDWWFKHFVDPYKENESAFTPDESTGTTGKVLNQVGNLVGMLDQIMLSQGTTGEVNAIAQPTVKKMLQVQTEHAIKSMAVPAMTSGVNTARDVLTNGGTESDAVRAGLTSYLTNIAMGFGPLSVEGNLATRLGTGAVYGVASQSVNHDLMNLALPDNQQMPELTAEDQAIGGLLGGIMGGVLGPRPHETFADLQRANNATQLNLNLQKLAETASLSKLRARDPESFKQFVQNASEDGELQKVYIDANTLHDALNQSGITPEQVKTMMPEVAAQMDVSRETNADVSIPIADFATHIAGTDLQNAILGHLKVEPDGMTYDESQKFYADQHNIMKEEADKIVNQKLADDDFIKSAKSVEDNLYNQLKATGRYSDDVAKANALLLRDFYLTNAHRLGIKPHELFDKMPVRIGAEDLNGGLNQSFDQTNTPEFKNWFGDSKVTDESGKPLVVYHGTSGDFNTFESSKSGAATGAENSYLGFFFSDKPAIASAYANMAKDVNQNGARNIIPTYLTLKNPLVLTAPDMQTADKMLLRQLRDKHDGAIIKVGNIPSSGEPTQTVYMVRNSTQIKSAVGNNGDFNPNDANILHQDKRGAFDPTTNTIALLKAADLSTFHHEAGHFFLESLDRLADSSPEIAADFNKTLDWFGIHDTPEMSAIDQWRDMSLEQKRDYHEKFARGFEAYLLEGKSPSLEMASTFQRFKAWMMRVYQSIKELGVELNPEIRGVYDRLLATDEQIKTAEQSRSMLPMFTDAERASMTPEEFTAYHALAQEASDNAASELQSRSLRDMKWLGNKWDKAFKENAKDVAEKRRVERIEARRQVMQEPVYQAWQFLTGKMDKLVRQRFDNAGIDPEKDNLLKAIAKLGGLKKDEVVSTWGTEAKDVKTDIFGKPVLRVNGGESIDRMAELLSELGYLNKDADGKWDLHEFEDLFADSVRGKEHLSMYAHESYGDEEPAIKDSQGRLNNDVIRGRYGDEVYAKLNKLHMTRSDGLNPDDVAEFFGIKSGDELINSLINSPAPNDAIEAKTDQLMLEKYGDITSDKALAEAADKAIHNEVRARVLATELKALTKSAGKVSDIVRAAKEAAESTIGQKLIKDIDTRVFTAAEARAGREAMAAFAKGETQRAATEKRNQILNNQFAKAAIEGKADVDKLLKYFKKFDKDTVAKAVGADYMDRINELLSNYDLTKRDITKKGLEERQALRDWLNSEFERTGIMPEIDDSLLDFAGRKSYMEMTLDEFRSLGDAVKSLEHVGREQQQIVIDGKKVDLAEMVSQALEQTKDLEHREPVDIQPHLLHARGLDKLNAKWLNLKSKLRSADASLIKMEQLFQWLSSGKRAGLGDVAQGPYMKIFKRAADAEGYERQLRAEAVERIKGLQKELGDAKVNLNESLQLPLSRPTRGNQWYREELLAMALNMGNKGNREKLAAGYNWDIGQVDHVLDKVLSDAEWKFVQGVWDAISVYGKDIAELQRRQTGITPKMVEPVPFKNSHGAFEGGYYPVVYDSFLDNNIELKNARNADSLFENQWARPATSKGHTINRTNYVGPIHLSLSVIGRHIDQVTHDLAWREAIIDMNKFLSHSEIRKEVDQVMGKEYTKQFRPWLQALANDKVFNTTNDSGWESLVKTARTNATIVGLGFRFSTMEIHGLSALSNSIGEVGAKWFAKGAAQFSTPDRWKDSVKFIFDRSPEMANRMNESDRNIHEAISDINRHQEGLEKITDRQRLVDNVRKFSMYGVSALDMGSAMPTWMGAYLKGMEAESKGGLGLSENDAIDYANRAVRNAHGGGGTKDLSSIQRNKGALSLMTMFYSFWNHMYNRQRDLAKGYANVGESFKQGSGTHDFTKLLARSWWYFVVPQIVHAALKPNNNQDDSLAGHLKHLAEEIGLGFVSGVPIVRDLANSLVHGRDYTISPVEQAGKTLVEGTVDTYKLATGEQASKHAGKHIVNMIGYTAGLPTGQASSTADFFTDVLSGEQNPQSLADWWAGIHTGKIGN